MLAGHLQFVELSGAGAGDKGIGWSVLWDIDPTAPANGVATGNTVVKELFPSEVLSNSYVSQSSSPLVQTIDCSQCFSACSLDITGMKECKFFG